MLFLEEHAGALLIVHGILATAAVAASTHLVVWMRGYPRRRFSRHRATVRFAAIALVLYACTFLVGQLIYPTYKVRVRMEFLEQGSAVARDLELRAQAAEQAAQRVRESRLYRTGEELSVSPASSAAPETERAVHRAARLARWFDVKEHWIALGLLLSAACALTLRSWNPARDGPELRWPVFGMAVGAACAGWLAAVVGLLVTAARSVAGL